MASWCSPMPPRSGLLGRELAGRPLAAPFRRRTRSTSLAAGVVDGNSAPRHETVDARRLPRASRASGRCPRTPEDGRPAGGGPARAARPRAGPGGRVAGELLPEAGGAGPPDLRRDSRGQESAERDADPSRAAARPAGPVRVARAARDRRELDVIAHEIQRLDRVVQGFLRFVRPQDLRLAPVDINAVLSDVARVARPEAARSGVEIVLDLGRDCRRVTADAELIAQASGNLVRQCDPGDVGRRHAGDREPPRGVEREWRSAWQIRAWASRPRTSRRSSASTSRRRPGGSGIGLAMVYRIVQMHDGRVDVESAVGKGTTVTCHPARGPRDAMRARRAPGGAAGAGGMRDRSAGAPAARGRARRPGRRTPRRAPSSDGIDVAADAAPGSAPPAGRRRDPGSVGAGTRPGGPPAAAAPPPAPPPSPPPTPALHVPRRRWRHTGAPPAPSARRARRRRPRSAADRQLASRRDAQAPGGCPAPDRGRRASPRASSRGGPSRPRSSRPCAWPRAWSTRPEGPRGEEYERAANLAAKARTLADDLSTKR